MNKNEVKNRIEKLKDQLRETDYAYYVLDKPIMSDAARDGLKDELEKLEKEYPEFSKGLKWNLITSKIAKDNDLKTDFEDVKAFSREQVRQQMEMYNTSGNTIDDKTLDLLNDNMMQREDHVKKSYESAMEQKLFNFLESKVTLNDKKISFDDLLKNN